MAIKKKQRVRADFIRRKVKVEHTGFYPYLLRYNEGLGIRNYAIMTSNRRDSDLRRFIGWCEVRSLDHPNQITKMILEAYQQHLYYYRQDNGKPLSPTSRNHYISSVKLFFKWLAHENYLPFNPASEVIAPRATASRLPLVLTPAQVDTLLQQPLLDTVCGVRDRAILEVFYATGVRRLELCRLAVCDLVLAQQLVYVRKGKNGKDRVLPLGERATYWLSRYLKEARPQLVITVREETLFLNDYGERFVDSHLGSRVKRFMRSAGIHAEGSCHLLRHAMATHMLENGAELRYIQIMLGHADLKSTQIYTHVSIRQLQAIHAATHPAKLENKADLLAQLHVESEEDDKQ
jgi:integrase/recombinase XerD